MLIYVLLFFMIYIFAILDVTSNSVYLNKYIFPALLIILILFAGLRYEVGADYWGYYSYFNKASISIFGELEVGFEILIETVRAISGSYEVFVLIIVSLTFFFISRAIKSMSKIYLIPLYVYMVQYFLGGPMGQMRQALAIAILLYSIKFLISKDFKKFFFTVLFATSIHITSIIFLIAYLVNYMKLNKKFALSSIFISIFLGFTSLPSTFLVNISSLFRIDIFESLRLYVESDFYGSEYSGSILAYLERLLIFIVTLWFYRESDDRKIKVFIQIYWLSLIVFFLFSDVSILAQRLSRPFKVVEIFLYAYLIESFTRNKYLRLIGFLAISLLLYKPIYMIMSRPEQYIPYMNIWGK